MNIRAILWGVVFAAAGFPSLAGDVIVRLDSNDGGSGFEVADAESNVVLDVRSDPPTWIGDSVAEATVDQSQMSFSGDFLSTNCWQSFTVGRPGRLTGLTIWHNQFYGSESILVTLGRGGGATGAVVWTTNAHFSEYTRYLPVQPPVNVSSGDVFSFRLTSGSESSLIRLGYGSGNPYPAGTSCRGASDDLLFMTHVSPTNLALGVSGNTRIEGTLTVRSISGDGAALTNIGNAALAPTAAIDPAKVAGVSLTQASTFGGDVSGSFTNIQIKSAAVGALEIASNTVVRSINGQRDAVTLAAGANMDLSVGPGTITLSATGPGVGVPSGALVLATSATNAALYSAGFSLFHRSESRDTWRKVTGAPGWTNRFYHCLSAQTGRMVLACGVGPGAQILGDIWTSTDGSNWTKLLIGVNPPRYGAASAVFDSKVYWFGGVMTNGQFLSDAVWLVSDNTVSAAGGLAWTARCEHAVLVFSNKLWLMGGRQNNFVDGQLNDVWSSGNGISFTRITNAAPWSIRSGFGSVVFNGRIWVLGGYGEAALKNDVWSSADGLVWTQATASAPWAARNNFICLAHDGRLWVIGGSPGDIWNSKDGSAWVQVTNLAPWGAVGAQAGVVHGDRMWAAGGTGGAPLSDVWCSGAPEVLGGFYLYQKD